MILSGSVSFRLWLQQLAANSGQWAAVACRAPAIRGNLMPPTPPIPTPTYKWLPSYPKMFFDIGTFDSQTQFWESTHQRNKPNVFSLSDFLWKQVE